MDKFHKQNIETKKIDTKVYVMYDSIYTNNQKGRTNLNLEVRMAITFMVGGIKYNEVPKKDFWYLNNDLCASSIIVFNFANTY